MNFYTIRNTSNDRSKEMLHRSAQSFTPEISIGGVRLSPGYQMNITADHFERLRDMLYKLHQSGNAEVVECKTEKGDTDPVMMRPERSPVPETNPHGVYIPMEPEVKMVAGPSAVLVAPDPPEKQVTGVHSVVEADQVETHTKSEAPKSPKKKLM